MNAPRWAVPAAATLWLLAAVFGETSQTAIGCTAPQEITRFRVDLPNTTRAVRSGKDLVILAIGSSSTLGVGASDPAHSYPARLAEELHRRWPQRAVKVINKGVGGEMAFQMLARFERDVLPYHPQLVIWQTGSNQVLRSGNIKEFADTLREGVSRLKAAHADIVLMDPQFTPRLLARPLHPFIIDSISAVGNEMKVAVFNRFAVMQHWVSSNQYRAEDITSSDGLHINDVSYGCIARLLADSIVAAGRSRDRRSAREREGGEQVRRRWFSSIGGTLRASPLSRDPEHYKVHPSTMASCAAIAGALGGNPGLGQEKFPCCPLKREAWGRLLKMNYAIPRFYVAADATHSQHFS